MPSFANDAPATSPRLLIPPGTLNPPPPRLPRLVGEPSLSQRTACGALLPGVIGGTRVLPHKPDTPMACPRSLIAKPYPTVSPLSGRVHEPCRLVPISRLRNEAVEKVSRWRRLSRLVPFSANPTTSPSSLIHSACPLWPPLRGLSALISPSSKYLRGIGGGCRNHRNPHLRRLGWRFRKRSQLRPTRSLAASLLQPGHVSPPNVPRLTIWRSLSQRKAVWDRKSVWLAVAAPPATTPNLLTPYPKLYPPPKRSQVFHGVMPFLSCLRLLLLCAITRTGIASGANRIDSAIHENSLVSCSPLSFGHTECVCGATSSLHLDKRRRRAGTIIRRSFL